MIAVLLVGGEGTRLRPLTYHFPKQILPVAGLPMIERVLKQFAAYPADNRLSNPDDVVGGREIPQNTDVTFQECVLSLGYKPERFVQTYPDGLIDGLRVSYAVEPEPLGTGGAVRFAAEHVGVTETFVVMNGDVLANISVHDLVQVHFYNRRHGALATIGLVEVDDPSRYGVVDMDASGQVRQFVEKPSPDEAPSNLINGGIYVLEPQVLDLIPVNQMVSIEREVFPELVVAGSLYATRMEGYWLDTGTPQSYIQANMDYLESSMKLSDPPVAGANQIAEGVWAVGHPIVRGSVLPPSLVMNGSLIEYGAVVSHSVIGENCIIGSGCRVDRSVVMGGVRMMQDSALEDSVLAAMVEVGEGAQIVQGSVVGEGYVVTSGSVLSDVRLPINDQ